MVTNFQQRDGLRHPLWVQHLLEYVKARQNVDGGYNFCQGVESGGHDTYYALAIFNLLDVPAPKVDMTVKWLRAFPADNIYGYFYIIEALNLCGEKIDDELVNRVLALRKPHGGFGKVNVNIEAYSEFDATYMATEILRELGISLDPEPTIRWLLEYQKSDGGFAARKRSNLISTFHAVGSLYNLGYPVKELNRTLHFVRSCEIDGGGFTLVPDTTLPFLEDTYAGVLTLSLRGQRCTYPDATRKLVLGLQNSNGGFRRSVELGISTFEDTYYALSILKRLP
jgi:hypothetical protein